ncbi:hypothetical protein EZS27_026885 [termite gut metagenome]|uniref:Glycoside hydrolase family 5 domain-containing protein n=1 Tax=termite gut metagenome TaxID=433724 RepID=A0A5J4QSZ6_9ZZZZ
MKHFILLFFLILTICAGCTQVVDTTIAIDTNTIINDNYMGNGTQWDPYQLDYGNGHVEISEADWEKLYARLDFMRPQFMRVVVNISSYLENNILISGEKNWVTMFKILDYCQSRDVTVVFGDWGHDLVNSREVKINEKNLKHAAELVDKLVTEKGYTCIKYYNLINEPNGDWSATNTSYPLWASAMKQFHKEMEKLQVIEKVGIIGPDIAIWNEKESWWIDSCTTYLRDIIQLYDIHTYPSKITVNSGKYTDIISAYKEKIPAGRKIVMGEIGLKYIEEADSLYQQENIRRAKSKKHASSRDSQMFVYDYMYGTDIADALFQAVNTGYSGSITWMLDDAMHSNESPDKLSVWGFWNILGDEYFGSDEENVRPWYYAWSLLTKYMPVGSTVYKTTVSGDPAIKAIAVEKTGNYMIAIVNVAKETKGIKLTSETLESIKKCRKFIYADGYLKKEGDHQLLPHETNLNLELSKGEFVTIPAESLIVFTSFNY